MPIPHSLISNAVKSNVKINKSDGKNTVFKPSHIVPFPEYPEWHEHVKLPLLLLQLAFMSQVSVPIAHSSISDLVKNVRI